MRNSIIKIAAYLLSCCMCNFSIAGLATHEATCSELGFKKRTVAYGECVLELDQRERNDKELASAQQQKLEAQAKQQAQQQAQEQAQQRGDGTPDHQTCNKFGFLVGTNPYSECRLKIDIARREQAQRQATFEAEQQKYQEDQRRYQAEVAEYERQKEKEKGLAMMNFGLALMGGTSRNFIENAANASRQTLGIAPTAPARPQVQNFTITNPNGRMTNCTVLGNNINCF